MKWLVTLIFCLCLFVGTVGAQDLQNTADGASFALSHANGVVIYNDTTDSLSFSHTTLVDGGLYNPTYVAPNAMSTTWGTGTNASTSQVLMTYVKNSSNILKGTIVLKSPHTISFPISLAAGEQIRGWNGGFAIVGTDLISQAHINDPVNGGLPAGIRILAPTATDANNSVVNVWYTLDANNVITLNIGNEASGAPVVYPLTIDPTVYLGAYISYLILYTPMNGTNFGTTFSDNSPNHFPLTRVGLPTTNTTTYKFGGASGYFNGTGLSYLSAPANAAWNFATPTNMTIHFWIYPLSNTGAKDIFGTVGSYTDVYMGNAAAGAIGIGHVGVNEITSGAGVISTNIWQEVDIVENASTTTIYVNGTNVASGGTAVWTDSSAVPAFIGYGGAGPATPYAYIDEFAIWKNVAIPIGTLYPQTLEIGALQNTLSANFVASNLSGFAPLVTQFTDTSTNASYVIDKWDWGFGDGTSNSTLQNPPHTYTSNGVYNVYLNITNSSYGFSSLITKNAYIVVTPSFPVPAFTANITGGNAPLPVKFTDMSVNGTQWNWTFGDGNVSILQNPTFTYNIVGIYSVNQTVSNVYGNSSLVKTNYITVNKTGYPYAGFTNNVNSGSPGLLVTFVDTSYQGTVSGETYLWDFNDPLSTSPTSSTNGSVTHVYAYAGVYYPTLTITNGAGRNIYSGSAITVSVQQNQQNSWYAPSQVRFTFQNMTGSSLSGILISATPQNMSAPPAWINTFFGVNAGVNLINTTVYGNTASDGAITMPMMQSILYLMTINGTATDGEVVTPFSFYIYPSQSDYLFNIPTTISPGAIQTAPVTNKITYSVGNITYNATAQYYNVTYYDPTGGTSNITYYVNDMNGTALYTQTVTGAGANSVSFSEIVSNPNGGTITTGFYASQSTLGTISDYDAVTFGNFVSLMGIAVPTWVEEWLALGLIILVACSFSYFSVPVGGVILIGLTGYFVWGIEWLQPIYGYSAMGTGLMILGMWAAIKYIRAREDRLS